MECTGQKAQHVLHRILQNFREGLEVREEEASVSLRDSTEGLQGLGFGAWGLCIQFYPKP